MLNIHKCILCGQNVYEKKFLEHLENEHYYQLHDFTNNNIDINSIFFKDIGEDLNSYIESIESEQECVCEERQHYLNLQKKAEKWAPNNFTLEGTTVWSFSDRGSWATHNGKYRGNWSPYIPRNLILRYTNKNDTVLDQFLGSGTTLVETKLLERMGIGVDINPQAIEISKENIKFNKNMSYEPTICSGDARKLDFIRDNSIDFICTHPPYANIIKYSNNLNNDLSLLDIDEFVEEMSLVAKEALRVLKGNKYCAILIGDTRRNKHIVPLGFKVMQTFIDAGFLLKETIIKEQHNCKATGFWYKRSIEYNFLLIAHEYLFVFRKP